MPLPIIFVNFTCEISLVFLTVNVFFRCSACRVRVSQRDIFLNDYSRGLNIRHDTYKTGQLFILL